jgi:starch synthase
MDIVWVAAEMVPFSKTGGLGDVAGAVPAALAARGHRVLAISPLYKPVPDAQPLPVQSAIRLFGAEHRARWQAVDRDGVRWLLLDHPSYRRPGIYGDDRGAFDDNLYRYALLSRAAIEAALTVPLADGAPLGDRVVFQANDWHTGLLPVYLDAWYRSRGRFVHSPVVLGLHNLGHQGSQPASAYYGLDLPARFWQTVEMSGVLNPLKAGLVSADALVAVSPTYARQIQVDHAFGLEGILRARSERLIGILNGIDPVWDPSTDTHLPAHFSATHLDGKAECKAALQREAGLPVRPAVPVIGLISRLDPQKGIDLLLEVAPWLLRQDVQLLLLGSGADRYESAFRELAYQHPQQVAVKIGFDESLAHRIEAGADMFVMPSRFEPCGLNQMYSMRYGTVPIVHATGGLADTVTTVDPARDDGTGWAFPEFTASSFAAALEYALVTYRQHPQAWRKIQWNGMTKDFSWNGSAALYEKVYQRALELRGAPSAAS